MRHWGSSETTTTYLTHMSHKHVAAVGKKKIHLTSILKNELYTKNKTNFILRVEDLITEYVVFK